MKQFSRFIHILFVTAWMLSLFAPLSMVSAQAPDEPPRAYPGLLQLANEQPNEKVRVIVQRYHGQYLPEQAINRAGGHKAKELPLINGLVLELPAKAVEARWGAVRHVVGGWGLQSYEGRPGPFCRGQCCPDRSGPERV